MSFSPFGKWPNSCKFPLTLSPGSSNITPASSIWAHPKRFKRAYKVLRIPRQVLEKFLIESRVA
jgi:hypothetical protein